ncbi:uncharacterized protein LOC144112656 isoform X2 [Amblyomma americanum]
MAVADVSAAMLVLIDGVETRVYAVLDEHGTHMKNDDGFLYETEGGLRISVLRVEEPMRNTPPPTVPAAVEDSSRGAPSPLWQTTPPPVCQPTPSPGPSCYSPPPSGGGERDAWSERKSRFLITKYKEAKDNIGRKGGFRTKKAMWEKLTDQINSEFGCHLTPLQVENKWKTMERAYKKSKAKNGSSGHSRAACLYERELSEVLEREHHITPVALLAPGRIVANGEKPSYPTANFSATPFA